MADVKFEDYTIKVQNAIEGNIVGVLEECAGELQSAAARNTRRDTGLTAAKWAHEVDEGTLTATVGNPQENAIWEEFGTGEHALEGNGRKGGWAYQDAKGDWHYTVGKKPSRAFYRAFTSLKNAIITRIQNSLKGL